MFYYEDDGDYEELCTIKYAECTKETKYAIYVKSGRYNGWVPKSIIHDNSEVYKIGHDGALVLVGWWAEKQKLELD